MPASPSSSCIVVIGMGRSGTSAIAGALQLLGVDLGNSLIGANRSNIKGHFENALIVKLNDAILGSLRSYNGDFSLLDAVDWMASPSYVAQARGILRAQFPASPLFAIKDPRMCRVWPIWAQALAAHGAAARFLVPLRDPVEVAQSLYGYGCSTNHGLMWWIAHMLDAEKHSRTAPRAIVPYPDLLAEPKHTLERIADVLELSWPKPLNEVEPSLNAFLDRSMHHRPQDSPVRTEAEGRILSLAEAVYQKMMAHPEPDPAGMDCARAEFAGMVESCLGWRPRLG